MRTIAITLTLLGAAAVGFAALPIPGDAQQGEQFFREQRCVTCHSINGQGGKTAPDLSMRTGRAYTPNTMASIMWNHAPVMWSAMEKQGVSRPKVTEEDAANLFAYFYAVRYFDRPGDAGRGKSTFASKGCAGCHSVSVGGTATPIAKWEAVSNPIALARAMWNHAGQMKTAAGAKNMRWPSLTPQEMQDIVVYIQNLPETRDAKPQFAPASAETGKTLFEVKGCAKCHAGNNSLENRFSSRTLPEFAAAMWNHSPKMGPLPELNEAEMRRIVGYLWSIQFFERAGDAGVGKQVFASKQCASCHGASGSGAPSLARREGDMTSFGMVHALWEHGPGMQTQMRSKNVGWPRFTASDMGHLIAYINTLK